MSSFSITIASPPDRDRLVSEVFVGEVQIAELNHEDAAGPIVVELYPRPDGKPWCVDLDEFVRILADARAQLLSRVE